MRSGILLVDKPAGPTSHDVVGKVRRRLGTRRVGHAGTLDPAATGLLVVLVEEGTKLAPYLSGEDKAYVATVVFGRSTDSGDAVGATLTEAAVPDPLRDELARIERDGARADAPLVAAALELELARTSQVPPIYSAIHVDGVRSHELARKGRAAELPPRDVSMRALEILGATSELSSLVVHLDVTKGYYVRSFARDLGEALGIPAHLGALRRTRSGAFDLDDAAALADISEEAILDVGEAAKRALPALTVDADDARLLRTGRTIAEPAGLVAGPHAVFAATAGGESALLAIVEAREGRLTVLRGFAGTAAADPGRVA